MVISPLFSLINLFINFEKTEMVNILKYLKVKIHAAVLSLLQPFLWNTRINQEQKMKIWFWWKNGNMKTPQVAVSSTLSASTVPRAAVLTSFSTWQLILTLLFFLPWACRNVCAAAHWTRWGNQSELKLLFFSSINFNLDQILNLVHHRTEWAGKGCWPMRKEGWDWGNINTILNCCSKSLLSHSCCSHVQKFEIFCFSLNPWSNFWLARVLFPQNN